MWKRDFKWIKELKHLIINNIRNVQSKHFSGQFDWGTKDIWYSSECKTSIRKTYKEMYTMGFIILGSLSHIKDIEGVRTRRWWTSESYCLTGWESPIWAAQSERRGFSPLFKPNGGGGREQSLKGLFKRVTTFFWGDDGLRPGFLLEHLKVETLQSKTFRQLRKGKVAARN